MRKRGGPIDLTIDRLNLDIGGRRASAIGINGTVPEPLVRLREGEDPVIRVTNRLVGEGCFVTTGLATFAPDLARATRSEEMRSISVQMRSGESGASRWWFRELPKAAQSKP